MKKRRFTKRQDGGKLLALVFVPTRELAVQVAAHLRAVADPCDVNVAAVIGGMSVQKQRRLLARQPEIIVATPGRFLAIMKEPTASGAYLSDLSDLAFLAIDEADRMVEASHFDEMQQIFARLPVYENPTPSKKERAAAAKAEAELEQELMRKKIEEEMRRQAEEANGTSKKATKKRKSKQSAETSLEASDLGEYGNGGDDEDGNTDDEDDLDGSSEEGESAADGDVTEVKKIEQQEEDLRPVSHRRRQTFVFSATLGAAVGDALAKSAAVRQARARRGLPPLPPGGLDDERTSRLLEAIDFQGVKSPEIVDLTNQSLTVRQLREYRVEVIVRLSLQWHVGVVFSSLVYFALESFVF